MALSTEDKIKVMGIAWQSTNDYGPDTYIKVYRDMVRELEDEQGTTQITCQCQTCGLTACAFRTRMQGGVFG